MRSLVAAALLLVVPSVASAQRVVAYDTLSGETPIALTCGFCAGESVGVIFRELPPPARGLDPSDFPLVLDALRIAVADADVTGTTGSYACEGTTGGGTALFDVAVWAGETPPSGSILALPVDGPWPGETLVWAGVDVPLELSVADAAGSSRYTVSFNQLLLEDEEGMPIRVEPPNTYIRVVLTLRSGATSSASCADLSLDPPGGFPVRDDDGVVAGERSFLYAAGAGWLWNEAPAVGLDGDWGIRIEVTSMGGAPTDGGTADADAGMGSGDAGSADADAGTSSADAGGTVDAGSGGDGGDDGCGCVAAGAAPSPAPAWLVVLGLSLALLRRRR